METDFRYRPGYRALMVSALPRYIACEIDPVMHFLGVGDFVVFDVGANSGVWSKALLAHSDRFVSELHMFEPLPGNMATIQKKIDDGFYAPHESKLKLNQCGVSDRSGSMTLHTDGDTSGFASFAVSETLMATRAVQLDSKVECPVVTLDEYCESNGIDQIDLLKVDVEGHEYEVLAGASGLLHEGRIRSVMFEFGTHQMATGRFFREFWNLLDGYGFQMHRLRGGKNGFGSVPMPSYSTIYEDFSTVTMFFGILPKG